MICSKCGSEGDISLFDKNSYSKDKSSGFCKKCKADCNKKYRIKNKEKIAKYFSDKWRSDPERRAKNKAIKEIGRSGMNATEYAKDKKCEHCGITNEKHIEKYNQRLHVHHKDDTGRKNIRLGLDPIHDNIQVLCVSCHTIESNKEKDYTGVADKVWKVRRERYGKSGHREKVVNG